MLGTTWLQASPLIFAQPTNANAFVGDASATFKVLATGDATLAYQWQMQPGSGSFSNIGGETGATLNVSSPLLTMSGYKYRCVVTCTGASAGTLTSAGATLSVYAVPAVTPTVTLSTNTIAADSTSDITIHITGLNANDTVRIQRVLDSDASGTADFGEPLVQSVLVTDGQVSAIGGVTNTSVPHDEDGAANGSIITHLSLPSACEMGRTAGAYLIRVSSPSGEFRTVQKSLSVTQPAYGQSISGQILAGSTPVPYAAVILISNGSNGDYTASAVANSAGNFTINAPVGSYQVIASQVGYVCSLGALSVNLTAGQVLTGRNPVLIPATCTIAGQVQDASGSPGLKGVQLGFESNTGYFSLATSDGNGNYVAAAVADQWKSDVSDDSLDALGYVPPSNGTTVATTAGNVTAQNLLYSAATALISGTVRNGAAAVMPGVILGVSPPNSSGFRTATDASGNFTFGVSGGTWYVQLDSGYATINNLIGPSLQENVTNGQGISAIAIQLASTTGTLSGYVHDSGGTPVSTNVYAYATIGGIGYFNSADTDGSGNYSFPVINGQWTVNVSQSGYTQQSVQVSGSAVVNFTPPPVIAHLQGTVTNNGVPVSGASIGGSLQGGGNTWIQATTDGSGNFNIGVTSNGTWFVQLESNYANSNNLVGPSLQEVVSNNASISGIAFHVLSGTGSISGYVHDAGGAPVSTSVSANATINGTDYFDNADTDGGGNYSFPAINGQWNVNVSQSGYTQQSVQVSGSAVVNFTPPLVVAHLQGTVTNNGVPVSGASIGGSLQGGNTWIQATTDGSGNFNIGVTSNGTWNVQLESNYANSNNLVGPSLQEVVSNNASISGIAFHVLSGTCTISGYVHDAGGLPVSTGVNANATINGVNYSDYANTDGCGNYSLPAINGQWNVNISQAGYTQQNVQVSGSAVVNFTPTLLVAHLQGTVTRSGSPLVGAILGATNNTTWIPATTNANGQFDISLSGNGTWYLRLDSGYADANYLVGPNLAETVTNSQSITNLSYPVVGATSLISGVVHDANGNPVATTVVATATLYGVNYLASATTDNNGDYLLPAINGSWSVNVTQAGYTPQVVTLTGLDFSPSSPFQQWQQTYFSIPQLADANTCGISAKVLSGAGCSNEMAYALGLDPKVTKPADLPTLGKTLVSGVYHQSLAFNRNLAATDLTYQVQFSTDLGNWTPLSTCSGGVWSPANIVNETPTGNPNLKNTQVTDGVPLGSGTRRFLRLVVTH